MINIIVIRKVSELKQSVHHPSQSPTDFTRMQDFSIFFSSNHHFIYNKRIAHDLAASRVLLGRLASEGDSSLLVSSGSGWLSLHSGLDLAGHGEKGLLNIARGFGRSFEELNSETVGEFFSLFCGDNTLSGQIGLVTHQQLVDILSCVSVDFVQPLLYIVERFVVRNIVNNNNSMGTTVVRRCNGTETLLSSGIPDLKLNSLSI